VVVITILLLAGCSAPSSNGPLSFSSSPDVACAPVPAYEHAVFAVNLPDDLKTDITLDSVTLIKAKNVKLLGTRLMAVPSGPRLLVEKYPPTADFAADWAQSRKAIGATVVAGSTEDLVLELRDGGALSGRIGGVTISYSAKGQPYVTRTHLSLVFKQAVHC
jgi:hypothetical protein